MKILGIDEIVSALLGEPLVLGEGQAIESPEEEFEGEQQDIKDDRYGNSNLKHGKATPLAPKEACQALGLDCVRKGQSQDEDQSGAGGKHRVQHRRSSVSEDGGPLHSS